MTVDDDTTQILFATFQQAVTEDILANNDG